MMNQVLSNSHDPMKGRQLPVMYSSKAHGFFTISGQPRPRSSSRRSAGRWPRRCAGDTGSPRRGSATAPRPSPTSTPRWSSPRRTSAPVILNIVNNQWAISTPGLRPRRVGDVRRSRATASASPSLRVDGNDYLAVYAASQWAAERARSQPRPDADRVGDATAPGRTRPPTIRPSTAPTTRPSAWPLGDPIERLKRHLIGIGEWDEERHAALRRRGRRRRSRPPPRRPSRTAPCTAA